jgi:hypothetical protein
VKPGGPPLANLLLAGVGKAGTTSLYWYLSQHPDVSRSTAKEPRYFLALSEADADVSGVLPPVSEYAQYFSRWRGERFRMEGTPHYFHGGERLVAGIRTTLDDPRIVILLRDPARRAVSIYRFAKNMLLLPPDLTFADFLERATSLADSGELQVKATRPYWSAVRGGRYADFLEPWFAAFSPDRLKIAFFEDIAASPSRVTVDVCEWLGLDTNVVAGFNFTVENQSVPYKVRSLQRIALALNGERILRNHPRLKRPLRAAYYSVNRATPRDDEIPAAEVDELNREFAAANRRLAVILRTRGCVDLPAWIRNAEATV